MSDRIVIAAVNGAPDATPLVFVHFDSSGVPVRTSGLSSPRELRNVLVPSLMPHEVERLLLFARLRRVS